MEAGEHGLPRGTRFVALCLEVVAVAGLMWVSWCVLGGAGLFFFFQGTTFSNSCTITRPLASRDVEQSASSR